MTIRTKAQLKTSRDIAFPTNAEGAITAAVLRTWLEDLIDSYFDSDSGADVVTAFNSEVAVATQAQAEAGTGTDVLQFTPERLAQAIAALASGSLAGNILGNIVFLGFTGNNLTGSQIDKGTPVRINGGSYSISVADSDGIGTMPARGLATVDIANSGTGFVAVFGIVGGLDTDGLTEGTWVYVSTSGTFTETPPASSIQQAIGYVLAADASAGALFIFPQEELLPVPAIPTNPVLGDDEIAFIDDSEGGAQSRRAD